MKKFRTFFLIGLLFVLATGCTPQKKQVHLWSSLLKHWLPREKAKPTMYL